MKVASSALIALLAGQNQYAMWEQYVITLADGTQLTYSSGRAPVGDFQELVGAAVPLVFWKLDELLGATTGADSGSLGLPLACNSALTTFGHPSLCGGNGSSVQIVQTTANPMITAGATGVNLGAGNFTLLAVIQSVTAPANRAEIVSLLQTNATYTAWGFYVTAAGNLELELNTSNAPGTIQTIGSAGPSVVDGASHFVVARRSGSSIQLFCDMVPVGSGTFAGAVWASPSPIGCGCGPWSAGVNTQAAVFSGVIDAVAIFDRAVSDAELTTFRNSLV